MPLPNKILKIRTQLMARISEGQSYGRNTGKFPSRASLASKFHVSIPTMARAMEPLLKQGFIQFVPGKGYFVPSTSERRVLRVAVVGRYSTHFETAMTSSVDTYWHAIHGGLLAASEKTSCLLTFVPASLVPKPTPQAIQQRGFDALLTLAFPWDADTATEWIRSGIPFISANRTWEPGTAAINYVDYDQPAMLCEAIDRLRACGHQRIGFITLEQSAPHAIASLQDLVARHLLTAKCVYLYHDYWVVANSRNWHQDRLEQSLDQLGRTAARKFLALPEPPTAVFCFSPLACEAFVEEMKQAGWRVPQHLSIITVTPRGKNVPFAAFEHDASELTRRLMTRLRDLWTNRIRTVRELIPFTFRPGPTVATPQPVHRAMLVANNSATNS